MQKSSRFDLERQGLRIERRRQVAHVENVLPESSDVFARVGAEAADQGGRDGVPVAGRASRGIVGEITKRARAPSSPVM